jgi:hypothetical protein
LSLTTGSEVGSILISRQKKGRNLELYVTATLHISLMILSLKNMYPVMANMQTEMVLKLWLKRRNNHCKLAKSKQKRFKAHTISVASTRVPMIFNRTSLSF